MMRNKPAVRRLKKIEPPPDEEFPSTCPAGPISEKDKRSKP
jgi:hypothetical protein